MTDVLFKGPTCPDRDQYKENSIITKVVRKNIGHTQEIKLKRF